MRQAFVPRWGLLALALLAAVACAETDSQALFGRVDHVADGDTLTLVVDGERHRIRLHEIDAPEHGQPASQAARRALADKVDGRYVRVTVAERDDYGRLVGKVRLGDRDINRELVREGHAWAYRRYLEDRSLLADEAAAREAGRGLWAATGPVPPWEWRQRTRGAGSAQSAGDGPAQSAGCMIKGNVSRSGKRIYHLPEDPYYAETRINTAQGERWFCSPAEAERAGWRRARSR